MYTVKNFKTKKQLIQEVKEYIEYIECLKKNEGDVEKSLKETNWLIARKGVKIFAPGLGCPKENGWEPIEGPHYPAPHTWYAMVLMENSVIVKVR